MKFSQRTAWDTGENVFAARVREARANAGLLDLTAANPTACGFTYDGPALLQPLSEPAAALYQPEPFGMRAAREAVARYYADAGASISTANICLTTSTSEAYSYLFRLLCDPGDEVLVATPSYPLFDFIAGLDGVRLVEYPLLYHDGWLIDSHAMRLAMTERTRAVIVVHPNNPTGHFCRSAERTMLEALCVERGLALIVDEVFLDYGFNDEAGPSFLANKGSALTFVLSGVSKVCGLPQMKCSWIAARGPAADVDAALARLEIVADTFLSMNAPVQHALPRWLRDRKDLQQQITARMRSNLVHIDQALAGTACTRLVAEAGWTCVLRVPRNVHGMPFAEAALEAGVMVQPGNFYGLPEGRVVLSLLTPSEVWSAGLQRLLKIANG